MRHAATRRALGALTLLCAIAITTPFAAHASQGYDNCTGFIESLPITIGTQGTWCLDQNLSTAITSGAALTIAANNVTLDCNGYKIGGLAAGNGSHIGIRATHQTRNTTVRNCNVRGFAYGIQINGPGALVEDNRLDSNLYVGIYIGGENSLVRRNTIYDTGGPNTSSIGIYGTADMIDNTVAGVFGTGSATYAYGIITLDSGTEIRGNRVRGLVVNGPGTAIGIRADGPGVRVERNHVSAQAETAGHGILFSGAAIDGACNGNTVANFATDYEGCDEGYGNLSLPVSFEIPPFPPNP